MPASPLNKKKKHAFRAVSLQDFVPGENCSIVVVVALHPWMKGGDSLDRGEARKNLINRGEVALKADEQFRRA